MNINFGIVKVCSIVDASWCLVTLADGKRIYCEDGAPYREPTVGPGRSVKRVRDWKCGRKKNALTCSVCFHRACRCKSAVPLASIGASAHDVA